MIKITKPFKGATLGDITQFFNSTHRALDWAKARRLGNKILSPYGTPLVAPERSKVVTIYGNNLAIDDSNLPNTVGSLKNGYGVWMKGLETGYMHLYWHTQPILPISVGEIVERGQIVAFEGNAGNVMVNGTYVPLDQRLDFPYPGTHLHQASHDQAGQPIDPLTFIDMETEPTYTTADLLVAISKTLGKMSGILS